MTTTKKVSRRKDGHVVVEVKFPEGKRNCDLSDGRKYGEDWVLLSEIKEGAKKRKAKKPAAAPAKKHRAD